MKALEHILESIFDIDKLDDQINKDVALTKLMANWRDLLNGMPGKISLDEMLKVFGPLNIRKYGNSPGYTDTQNWSIDKTIPLIESLIKYFNSICIQPTPAIKKKYIEGKIAEAVPYIYTDCDGTTHQVGYEIYFNLRDSEYRSSLNDRFIGINIYVSLRTDYLNSTHCRMEPYLQKQVFSTWKSSFKYDNYHGNETIYGKPFAIDMKDVCEISKKALGFDI